MPVTATGEWRAISGPRAERVDRPAADRRDHQQIAALRRATRAKTLADDQVDARQRQRGAGPVQLADPLDARASQTSSATSTGVTPSISELFATLVRDRPAMKQY